MSAEIATKNYLKDESLSILKVSNLKLLQDAPEKALELVKNNEFLTPNSENIEICETRRKALKQGRIDIQKVAKDITGSLNAAKSVIISFEKEVLSDVIEAENKQTSANQMYIEEQDWNKAKETDTREAYEKYISNYSKKGSIPAYRNEANEIIDKFIEAEQMEEDFFNDFVEETTQKIYKLNTSADASLLVKDLEEMLIDSFKSFADKAQEKRDYFLELLDKKVEDLKKTEILNNLNSVKSAYQTDINKSTLENIGSIVQSLVNYIKDLPDFGEFKGEAMQSLSTLLTQAKERQSFLIQQKEMAEQKAEMEKQQAEMKAQQEEIKRQKDEVEKAKAQQKAELERKEAEQKAKMQAELKAKQIAEASELHNLNVWTNKQIKAISESTTYEGVENMRAYIEKATLETEFDNVKIELQASKSLLRTKCNEKYLEIEAMDKARAEIESLKAEGKIKIDGKVYFIEDLNLLKLYFNSPEFQNLQNHSSESIDELFKEMGQGKADGKANWKDLTDLQREQKEQRDQILTQVENCVNGLLSEQIAEAITSKLVSFNDLTEQFQKSLILKYNDLNN